MIIDTKNLSFSYNVDEIFDNVNFIINESDKIGLIGNNGSGKSTLVKCLTGELEASGKIQKKDGLKISILKQQITLNEDISVMNLCLDKYRDISSMEERMRELEKLIASNANDEVKLLKLYDEYGTLQEKFHDMNGYGFKSEIKGYLSMVGLDESFYDRNVMTMSGGERARLELALVFMEKADLLILDEPTNHMDTLMIEYLEKFMKEFRGSIIFISHDRLLLQNVATRIFELENGQLKVYNMGYDEYRRVRQNERDILEHHYLNFKKEEERLKEIIRRFRSYATEKYHKLADSREKMLKRLKEEKPPEGEVKFSFNFKEPLRTGNDVLTVLDLSKSFGDRVLFKNVSFEVKLEDRVAILGPNGSGKTTLFKILLGKESSDGEFLFGTGVKIGYFNQELVVNDEENTLVDEISDDYPKMTMTEIRTKLGAFLFRGEDVFKQMKDLSGGERARVSLLKLILSGANVLFLDEPTNHLDIDSKEVLEAALDAFKGTLVFISHDRFFIRKLANKILDMTPGKQKFYDGDYDYYISRVTNNDKEVAPEVNRTEEKKEQKKEREKIRQSQKVRREVETLEEEIDDYENKIKEIDELLNKSETYEDHTKALSLSKEREEVSLLLKKKMERWVELQSWGAYGRCKYFNWFFSGACIFFYGVCIADGSSLFDVFNWVFWDGRAKEKQI